VLTSAKGPSGGASNYGSGFLPTSYGGIPLRSSGDPVLYLSNPRGVDRETQRASLDTLGRLNEMAVSRFGDPETASRIQAYEMAYKLQSSAPELMNLADESPETLARYGIKDPKQAGYARNCLLARRLLERGVRFVQLFHEAWDQHGDLTKNIKRNCGDTEQASAALVMDLKERGLLDDTIVIWGANSAARRWCKAATTAATTTTAPSRCGWPAAASRPATCTARPTTSGSTWPRISCMCTISMRRFCTSSASITRSSRIASRAGITGSPTCTAIS
jgi:hypothetical protein